MSAPYDIDTSVETAELLEIARVQLRETPEIREKGFKELRELLHKNPDLKFREDDAFLEVVLRCCHWYAEGAIKLVSGAANLYGNCIFYHPPVNFLLLKSDWHR